jgi:hypothetical protein
MSEEQTTFKVTDRRLFNPDGTPRELTPEEKQEAASSATSGATVIASTDAQATVTSQARPEAPAQPRAQRQQAQSSAAGKDSVAEEDVEPADARDPASFVNFIMSIASNAASSLGMMEHPVTHEREVDLELAKHWIDVLGMLQKKTRGNLTSQEQQMVEGLLSDLRMQFVSLAESPRANVAPPLTGRDIIGGK